MYNELYNATNEKHGGGKGETMNQLGLALYECVLSLKVE